METENYYGSLCTEMYEILHPHAPEDELAFYLSYAQKGQAILEPLCGNGRFLVPFWQRGLNIKGMDNSAEMLAELKRKAPEAEVWQCDLQAFETDERFDYIFISSGSMSLFTDKQMCKRILAGIKALLREGGTFVFAVDTVACRCPDTADYRVAISVKTAQGHTLNLRSKDTYDEATQTQFSPAYYELYDGDQLLKREPMDFQTHLYTLGEMEAMLAEAGFTSVKVYAGYDKQLATSNETEMFLYECR